jgi:hypothetical protein
VFITAGPIIKLCAGEERRKRRRRIYSYSMIL